jgi:hypothetical protein
VKQREFEITKMMYEKEFQEMRKKQAASLNQLPMFKQEEDSSIGGTL